MRIVLSGLLSTFVLGAAVTPGWCPEPADMTAPLSASKGSTADPRDAPATSLPWRADPRNPENMTRTQRLQMLAREKAAGRVTNDQQAKNFLETGNPNKVWTPPERKPLVKPAGMSDAQWQRVLATRAKPENFVRGTPGDPYGYNLEQNAKNQGGRVTTVPGAPTTSGPPPFKTTTPAPSQPAPYQYSSAAARSLDEMAKMDAEAKKAQRHNTVTKLGVHHTQAQPATPARIGAAALVKAQSSAARAAGTFKPPK